MGKVLIVKGADFSRNAVPVEKELLLISSKILWSETDTDILNNSSCFGILTTKSITIVGIIGVFNNTSKVYVADFDIGVRDKTQYNHKQTTIVNQSDGSEMFYLDTPIEVQANKIVGFGIPADGVSGTIKYKYVGGDKQTYTNGGADDTMRVFPIGFIYF